MKESSTITNHSTPMNKHAIRRRSPVAALMMKEGFMSQGRRLFISVGTLSCLLLSSCASSATKKAPPAGMAVIDATPGDRDRDRIDGIHFVSVNGQKTRGSLKTLPPGKTKVRVGFSWPQGGTKELDLAFQARPNTIYDVRYDVYPPYVERLSQGGVFDATLGEFGEAAAGAGEGAILLLPVMAVMGTAAAVTRVSNEVAEQSKSAQYVDVRVVARHCAQGLTCNRRIYADGRVVDR